MKPNFKSGAFASSRYSNDGASVNWGNVIDSGINSVENILVSIFGRHDKVQVDAMNQIYENEKRNNIILWVVIGLMLVLAAIVVLRKK